MTQTHHTRTLHRSFFAGYLALAAGLITALSVGIIGYLTPLAASSTTSSTINGWVWNDSVGWISLNCATGGPTGNSICATSNYAVTFNTDNTLTGYAWSDIIGWIKFGGLSGFPSVSGTSAVNAQVSGSAVTGWVRACTGTSSGDCSSMSDTSNGWDGWIYLGSTGNGDGVSYYSITSTLAGYAWGGATLGWFSFGALVANLTSSSVTGWVWSDNVGWISLNCLTGSTSGGDICASESYGVRLQSTGALIGYGWSDNTGWIKFGGLSGFPSVSGTSAVDAQISGSAVIGWARACTGTSSGDCSTMTNNENGWDGWIYLGSTGNGDGVSYNTSSGAITGYAWGDQVLGWLSFDAAASASCTASAYCVDANTSGYRDQYCQASGVTTACAAGCNSTTGLCTALTPPSGCLSAGTETCTPAQVRYLVTTGDTALLYWAVTSANSCSVTGSNGDSWTGLSKTVTTSAITGPTNFTLSCTSDGGTLSKTVTVSIYPVWQEK